MRIPGVEVRLVVIVGTFQGFPVVKTLTAFRWNVCGTAAPIHMPLADIGGIISGLFEGLANANNIITQVYIIYEYAVAERILPGKKRCPGGAAYRATRYGMCKIDALRGQAMGIWRLHYAVTAITTCLGALLIGKDVDDIWG